MNEYEVRVTRQALEQMKEIVHYISNDLMAPDAADNLLDKMKAEITKLSSFPKKHALIDEEPWRAEGVRKIVVKNFLIYYWVDDENNRVQVTAVIYSRSCLLYTSHIYEYRYRNSKSVKNCLCLLFYIRLNSCCYICSFYCHSMHLLFLIVYHHVLFFTTQMFPTAAVTF